MKQVEAAAQLGIDQAQVPKFLAGQVAGFSIERLVHFLSLLGQDIEVTVRMTYRHMNEKGFCHARGLNLGPEE
jgi:predicted XRE-type DNA-binding protein